jgi:hypothetical protein
MLNIKVKTVARKKVLIQARLVKISKPRTKSKQNITANKLKAEKSKLTIRLYGFVGNCFLIKKEISISITKMVRPISIKNSTFTPL